MLLQSMAKKKRIFYQQNCEENKFLLVLLFHFKLRKLGPATMCG